MSSASTGPSIIGSAAEERALELYNIRSLFDSYFHHRCDTRLADASVSVRTAPIEAPCLRSMVGYPRILVWIKLGIWIKLGVLLKWTR